jgi:hypothetical protein
MHKTLRIVAVTAIVAILPFSSFAAVVDADNIVVKAQIISVINFLLFLSALIPLKELIWPSHNNRIPFLASHAAIIVVFYLLSLPFLINHRYYYEGYENLVPLEVVTKFFFSLTITSAQQWVIIAAFLMDLICIKRIHNEFYSATHESSTMEYEESEENYGTVAETVTNSEISDHITDTVHNYVETTMESQPQSVEEVAKMTLHSEEATA